MTGEFRFGLQGWRQLLQEPEALGFDEIHRRLGGLGFTRHSRGDRRGDATAMRHGTDRVRAGSGIRCGGRYPPDVKEASEMSRWQVRRMENHS
jgi:hypothetical protein